jgi:hypothetical protein
MDHAIDITYIAHTCEALHGRIRACNAGDMNTQQLEPDPNAECECQDVERCPVHHGYDD